MQLQSIVTKIRGIEIQNQNCNSKRTVDSQTSNKLNTEDAFHGLPKRYPPFCRSRYFPAHFTVVPGGWIVLLKNRIIVIKLVKVLQGMRLKQWSVFKQSLTTTRFDYSGSVRKQFFKIDKRHEIIIINTTKFLAGNIKPQLASLKTTKFVA